MFKELFGKILEVDLHLYLLYLTEVNRVECTSKNKENICNGNPNGL